MSCQMVEYIGLCCRYSFHEPMEWSISTRLRLGTGRITYRRTLMAKVVSQAIKTTSNTDARAFCLSHIVSFRGSNDSFVAIVQALVISDKVSKAKLRFAESKTMKIRSRNINLILAFADRRPNGFPVYSSYVIYTR